LLGVWFHFGHVITCHGAVRRFNLHHGGWSRQHAAVLSGQRKRQDVARQGVVADGSTQRAGDAAAGSLDDDGSGLCDEVNTHNTEVLNHGDGANHLVDRVVHHHAVAGVVVAGSRVVGLVGDVQGNLGLAVVVRGGVEDGVGHLVSQLQVGVLDRQRRGTGDAVVDVDLLHGVREGGERTGRHRQDGVASTGIRGRVDAV